MTTQHTLLKPVPKHASFLTFDLRPGSDANESLSRVAKAFPTHNSVLGVGLPLTLAMGATVQNLRAFPALSGAGVSVPSTQGALWMMLGGADASTVFDASMAVRAAADPGFVLREEVCAFEYRGGRDLTGYEDGTENPKGTKAISTAIIRGVGKGYDGGSFAATQRYVHDLAAFAKLSQTERDHVVGRHHKTNKELPRAPESAHVKRTAQESFPDGGFMLRRSMPWGDSQQHGLVFVAYGASPDPFERVLRRMAGLDDGIVDSMLRVSRAVTGGYYFCPPMIGSKLDLSALRAAK